MLRQTRIPSALIVVLPTIIINKWIIAFDRLAVNLHAIPRLDCRPWSMRAGHANLGPSRV